MTTGQVTCNGAHRTAAGGARCRRCTPLRVWLRLSGVALSVADISLQVLRCFCIPTNRRKRPLRRCAVLACPRYWPLPLYWLQSLVMVTLI